MHYWQKYLPAELPCGAAPGDVALWDFPSHEQSAPAAAGRLPVGRATLQVVLPQFHISGEGISQDLTGDSTGVRSQLKNSRSVVCLGLFQRELIGDVVFVDIADVLDGFLSDVLRRHEFNIPEPLIGVKPLSHCLFP